LCSGPATRSTCLSGALAALLLALPGASFAGTRHEPQLGIAAEMRYDSDALAGGGAELMTKLSPRAGYRLRNERRQAEIGYGVDLVHHAEAGNVGVDHRGQLAYRDRLTRRLTLSLEGSLFRVEDTATLPRFGVAQVRSGALWAIARGSARLSLSRTESLELGYRGEATRLLRAGQPLGTVHAPSLRYASLVSRRLELGVSYRYQLFSSGSARFADTHAPGATLRYRVARHTFFLAEAGPMFFRSKDASALEARLRAELQYEVRGVEAGLSAGRDYVGSAGGASALWADYVQSALTWRLGEAFMLYGAAGLFRNGLAPSHPSDLLGYGLSAGVEWRFARGLAANLGLDRLGQIDRSDQGLSMVRNIISLRLSYRMQ
jgi:hypothetical protein